MFLSTARSAERRRAHGCETGTRVVGTRESKMIGRGCRLFGAAIILSSLACMTRAAQTPSPATEFDLLIKGGTLYDGSGDEGRVTDVAIRGDRIVGVGDFPNEPPGEKCDRCPRPGSCARILWTFFSWSNDRSFRMGDRKVKSGKV